MMPAHLLHTPSASDAEVTNVVAAVFERINVPSLQDPEPLIKSDLRDEAEQVTTGETENSIVFASNLLHTPEESLLKHEKYEIFIVGRLLYSAEAQAKSFHLILERQIRYRTQSYSGTRPLLKIGQSIHYYVVTARKAPHFNYYSGSNRYYRH